MWPLEAGGRIDVADSMNCRIEGLEVRGCRRPITTDRLGNGVAGPSSLCFPLFSFSEAVEEVFFVHKGLSWASVSGDGNLDT